MFRDLLESILEEKRASIKKLPAQIEKAKEDLKVAQSFGDARENYDLKLAKERRLTLSKKLRTDTNWVTECERYLEKYMDDTGDTGSNETITIGTRIAVTITDKYGSVFDDILYIVPKDISFSSRGLISDTCPAGKALMGKRAGDVVNVIVGTDSIKYKINSIG